MTGDRILYSFIVWQIEPSIHNISLNYYGISYLKASINHNNIHRMTEKELLIQYRVTGDLDLLGKLYAPYMSLLYGVCFKYLQDQDKSQDAALLFLYVIASNKNFSKKCITNF